MQFSARLAAGAGKSLLVEVLLENGVGERMLAHGSISPLVNMDNCGLAGAAHVVTEGDVDISGHLS